ncbi:MAG: Cache 3/Cache 2 fusion domain-containing protein, partial [Vallitaleaceae bacterium]|nr:Cache 3/Cache 2 fusion domain-containing protein [Vallitaleaceae bacterium]
MKRISSLRNKLIISIFIGCLVPYIIGGLYLKSFMEKWLYQDNMDQTNRLLFQIAENIDHSVIQNVSESVSMLSENDLVKLADISISNYTAYDADHFQESKSDVEKNISAFFSDVYISHLPYNFIFLGTSQGGYIEYPKFKPNSPYDPTQRPWYKSTIVDNKIHISDPYITKITKEMIMSFTKKVVSRDGHDLGVVGVAVKIEDLTQRIGSIRIGTSGYIVVLNSNDKIVISPKNPEWVLKTPEELNNTLLTELPSKVGKAYEAVLDGEAKVMNMYISPDNGWKVVSIVNKKEVVGKSQEMTNILLMIYTLTLLIILVVVVFISSRITEPILRISKVIDRMAAFDVKHINQNGVESYLGKKDEIGIISNALAGMQGNFVELSKSIQEMDEEIKNIDVQKDTEVRLSLSDNNPFNGVTKSFNALLEKVHTYFDQLKDSNREINEKNELLMTSEEELQAQIEEIETQKEYINFLAYHDPLTELPNRRYFIEELER